ncbi:hypothetical protein DFH27DRAFT_541066 [Peziza echinospora]|nr:hypothetical protein DFH27DRAFT_541066 [Peziza echinospora]
MLEAEARENGTWKGVIHEITGLPIPPVLQFPERYVPYSKRNPKERPKPGVQKLDERGEALKVNPYAHILDSSLRQSHPHQSRLPSFLLLSFSLLKNPLAHPSKREKETYFLPTNILPSAASRSLSGQKSYVENSHVTIFNLKRKNTWRRLIPEDRTSPSSSKGGASPGNKEIHWRDDMSEYILSSLRKRVAWEAEKMHKVLPRASVYPVDTRGRLLNHSDNSLLFSGKERDYNSPLRKGKPVVSCILKWLPDPDDPEGKKKVVTDPARRTPHDPSEWLPVGKGKLHKLPSQETVPVHDVNLLMGRVEGERLKETLGLDKKVTMAAIVRHHQTYKTQMWLMKLRYYFK